jgi:hypothetical protein
LAVRIPLRVLLNFRIAYSPPPPLGDIKGLSKSSKGILYDESNGCGKEFTQLRVVLELLKLKVFHG